MKCSRSWMTRTRSNPRSRRWTGARWIAARIFNDQGTSSLSATHQAFQWLLDPDGNPVAGATVTSLTPTLTFENAARSGPVVRVTYLVTINTSLDAAYAANDLM